MALVVATAMAEAWCAGSGPAVQAQDAMGVPPVPAAPADVTAAKAYAALERNCASCHQTGRIVDAAGNAANQPAGGLDNILALDEIAGSRWLVRAGLPDASRIYNVALTGERHFDVFNDPAQPGPSPAEVQALRDWIQEMQAEPAAGCADRAGLGASEAIALIVRDIRSIAPETARLTRYVTLASLANSCAPATELARAQRFLAEFPANAAGAPPSLPPSTRTSTRPSTQPNKQAPPFSPIDDRRLVWRVSLRGLGMTPEDWERQAAATPYVAALAKDIPAAVVTATGSRHPIGAADWLDSLLEEGDKPGASREGSSIAALWRRPGTLQRLAGDLWMKVPDLERRLSGVPASVSIGAHRLLGGAAVSREELDRLAQYLVTGSAPDAADPPAALEIALWADKSSYGVGDAARFSVTTNRDCYLTLIGIDGRGRATVLYPSEFEPANWLPRGKVLQVPAVEAPYRFRFKVKGRETFVAVCSTTQKSPPGLAHDFDRLRFTVLGDWQLFLREPPEMKEARRDDAATDTPRPQARQRRRGRGAETKESPAVPAADVQTRTAISIVIQ